jgi:sterol desaturase/sphingolipid hydroxylase (fatty acid hydroxylase superfamily)
MHAAACPVWLSAVAEPLCRPILLRFDFVVAPVLGVGVVVLLWLEHGHPLRRRTQRFFGRLVTNAAVAIPTVVIMRAALLPLVLGAAMWVDAATLGVMYVIPLPPLLRGVLAFLLMDYTTYVWHRLNHVVPIFWRFHRVHHTDLDLDVSTAFRFHFGEMLWSIGARTVQILVIGVAPVPALIWEGAEFGAAVFHHSNVRIPIIVERFLNALIVTPRMHGIHHSIVERETNANWSVLFSFWDRLHRSLRLDVPQDAVVIGLPAHRDSQALGFASLLAMPFREQGSAWRLPSGEHPHRDSAGDTRRLAG